MNHFAQKSAAARYTHGRPYFHPLIIARIREYLSLTEPLARALDVGCGTGLSTLALREIARDVAGVDPSEEMIALAPRDAGIDYRVSAAEQLPFDDGTFDLVTVCQAFHWFDRSRFLAEARRVLRPGGWLIVYDNYFSDALREQEPFRTWFRVYIERYPSPSRAPVSFTAEDSRRGFSLNNHEQYANTISFSPDGLIDFLVTQSNVIAAVEGGKEDLGSAKAWLANSIAPLFDGEEETEFPFSAPIWYLRHLAPTP